jgi:uncharacterized protein DUF6935
MTPQNQIQIDHIPENVEEFVQLRNEIAHTPEGGAAMLVLALLAYVSNAEIGNQYLTIAVDRSGLQDSPTGYKGWQVRTSRMQLVASQLAKQTYIPRSYIQGAKPENWYALPASPAVLTFSHNRYSGDRDGDEFKVFISCSGAATPRPVTLRRNEKGIWKAAEWSSLIVGIQTPPREPDDL